MRGGRQDRADQRRALRIEQHGVTGIPDVDGQDHLGQEIAADDEVDDADGDAASVVQNGDGHMEDHVVDLRIEYHVTDVGRAGCGLHSFTPPGGICLLRRQLRIR